MSKLNPVEDMSRAELDRVVKTLCMKYCHVEAAELIEEWIAHEAAQLQKEAERALKKDIKPAPVHPSQSGFKPSVKDRMSAEFGSWGSNG